MKKFIEQLVNYFAAAAFAEVGAFDMAGQMIGEAGAGEIKRDEQRKRPLHRSTVLNVRQLLLFAKQRRRRP